MDEAVWNWDRGSPQFRVSFVKYEICRVQCEAKLAYLIHDFENAFIENTFLLILKLIPNNFQLKLEIGSELEHIIKPTSRDKDNVIDIRGNVLKYFCINCKCHTAFTLSNYNLIHIQWTPQLHEL